MKRIFHILILTILCSLAYGQDTLLYRIGRVDSVPLTSEIKTFDLSGGKVYYNAAWPSDLPKTNLLAYWDYTKGINAADSTIYLVDADNNPVDTIKLSDVDFSLSSGYIPLKTAATFTMQSVNDIDTAFWDHDIYPTTVFANVDYDSTTYFKVEDHVLNSDSTELLPARITEIALYSQASDAMAYFDVPGVTGVWVNKYYAGGSNDGSYARPYTSIEDAYKGQAGGTIINVKSGTYIEENNGTTIRYLYLDKDLNHIRALGNVTLQTINTTYNARAITGTNTLTGIIFDGEGNTSYNINSYTTGNTKVILNNCVFKRATTRSIYTTINDVVMDYELNKCVSLNNLAADINTLDGAIISESYIHAVSYINNKFYHNKVVDGIVKYNTGSMICYNSFTAQNTMLSSNIVAASRLIIKGNTFNWTYANTGANHYIIYNGLNASQCTPVITNNNFYALETDSFDYPSYFINLAYAKKPEINYNYFESRPKSIFTHINLAASDSVFGKCQINYNTSLNRSLLGTVFSLGGETTKEGKFDSTEVIGNKGIGHLLSYPGMSASTHFILCNAGINFDIRYNDIEYTYLGLVIKTGGQKAYTNNGVFYNVFRNNARAIWIRGVTDLTIANNTFFKDISYNPYGSGSAIYLDENTANDGDQFCEDITLKNNLIYSIDGTPIIGMDQHAADNGCVVDTSVIYNTTDGVLIVSPTRYTVSEATIAGYFTGTLKTNPNLTSTTQLWPVIPFTGADLGTDYNTGLDISTTWGSSTTLPNIVTKQQGETWQIGAYVK